MASRKTLPVKDMIDQLHGMLSRATITEKPVICTMIENILHDSGNYAGFTYTFWNFETMDKYATVDDAIAAGVGTEYDRYYATHKI